MENTKNNAPAAEDIAVTEEKAETAQEAKPVTVGEALNPEAKKEPRMVPESALISYKEKYKQAKAEIAALLEKSEKSGASEASISKDIGAIAEEHNIDPKFLQDFADGVRSKIEQEVEEKLDAKLRPLTEKDRQERIDRVFSENFEKALEEMPEYKALANKDVIKSLSLDPKNSHKTFSQILEEAYGHLVAGRKTLDTTKPRGGKDDAAIDYEKAKKDPDYFREVMADPDLKKKYNEHLLSHISV